MRGANLSDKEISARLGGIVAMRRQGDEKSYVSELIKLYHLAPYHPRVSRRYVRHLIDSNQLEEARTVGVTLYDVAPNAYLAWDLIDLSSRIGDDDLLSRTLVEFQGYVAAGFSEFDADRYRAIVADAWHLDVIEANRAEVRAPVKTEPGACKKASSKAAKEQLIAKQGRGRKKAPNEGEKKRLIAEQRRAANQLAAAGRHDELLAMVTASPDARNDPAIRLMASAAHYATGQGQEALDDVDFVIASGNPQLVARARVRRANFLRNAGKNVEALGEYKILRKTPAAADLGFGRAMYRTLRAIGLGTMVDRYVSMAAQAYDRRAMKEPRFVQLLFDSDRQFELIALLPRLQSSQSHTLCFRSLLEVGHYYSAWKFLHETEERRASLIGQVPTRQKNIMDLCECGVIQSDDGILDFGLSLLKALGELREVDGVTQHRIMLSASSLGIGGCERQLLTLSKYAREHVPGASLFAYMWLPKLSGYRVKHDLRILAKEDAQHLAPVGWTTQSVTVHSRRFSVAEALELIGTIFQTASIDEFLRLVQDERPQIIHYTVGSIADFIVGTYLSGKRKIILQFGSKYLIDQNNGSSLFSYTMKICNKLIAFIKDDERFLFAINSKAAAESWAEHTALNVDDLDVIYNGLDEAFLQDVGGGDVNAMRSRLGLKRTDLVVGGVFRIHAIKDPFLWVRMVEQVLKDQPRAVGVLVGDGALRHRVAAMIERSPMRDRIRMYGEAHEELPVLYRCMDVLVVTSRSESLPNTVLEAQAQGTSVVSVNVGGIAEAVALGSIVNSRDSRDLAIAVSAILHQRQSRKTRVRKGRKFLRDHFGADVMVRKTFSCYGIAQDSSGG